MRERGVAHGGDDDGIGAIDELAVAQRLEHGGRGGRGEKTNDGDAERICFTGGTSLWMACGSGDRLPADFFRYLFEAAHCSGDQSHSESADPAVTTGTNV